VGANAKPSRRCSELLPCAVTVIGAHSDVSGKDYKGLYAISISLFSHFCLEMIMDIGYRFSKPRDSAAAFATKHESRTVRLLVFFYLLPLSKTLKFLQLNQSVTCAVFAGLCGSRHMRPHTIAVSLR
jgi:hypothetical protein